MEIWILRIDFLLYIGPFFIILKLILFYNKLTFLYTKIYIKIFNTIKNL